MVSRIDHISIAVKDFERADDFFTTLLGLVPGGSGRDEKSKFFFRVYSAGDLSRLEIISPSSKGSFLDNFLKDRDGGVHHITFQVPDIHEARSCLEKNNIPYFGFNDNIENWKDLFIHPSDAFGVLIQFAEFNPHEWINESETVDGGRKWEIKRKAANAVISILHPGGGKVDSEFSREQLDELIVELQNVRRLL